MNLLEDFDIRSLKKSPVLKVGGVGYTDSGASGSTNIHLHGTNVLQMALATMLRLNIVITSS